MITNKKNLKDILFSVETTFIKIYIKIDTETYTQIYLHLSALT